MNENILTVELVNASYPIIFGENVLSRAGELLTPALPFRRCIIITDANVAKHYLQPLQNSLELAGFKAEHFIVAAGEQAKSFANYHDLCERILALQPDRHTAIIALGGGVVGDLAGFVAATLLRGVPFVQIPTTLLAQVDSSVGGKVAINSNAGKNLVGAFYQPKIVLMDLSTLATLAPAELLSGYGEVLKYGLLGDAVFYEQLIQSGGVFEIVKNSQTLQQIIKHCCRMKAKIVAEDEREVGVRAHLNLGHTFAHAIEKATNYNASHGQAVALGCLMAMRLSELLGAELLGAELLGFNITPAQTARLKAHFTSINMPTSISYFAATQPQTLTQYCYGDKKASEGGLNFIALRQIGQAELVKNIDAKLITQIFAEFA